MLAATLSTEELLVDAKGGNGSAINQLLGRQQDSLRQLVRMRLDKKIQRRVSPNDVVQEVLIEASRRLKKYLDSPVMPFRLWLRQIAKDRMIDAYRRHRGSAKRSVDREQNIAAAGDNGNSKTDFLGLLVDSNVLPEEHAIRNEWSEQLQAAILLLPERDSEIVKLRHFEGLTNQEISRYLKLSEPAASMRYLRAIRRLRDIIASKTCDEI